MMITSLLVGIIIGIVFMEILDVIKIKINNKNPIVNQRIKKSMANKPQMAEIIHKKDEIEEILEEITKK